MKKHSFFLRNYLSHSLLIVLAFLLAGTMFSYRFGTYLRDEKQQQLQSTASMVASQTSVAAEGRDNILVSKLYNVYINQIASSDQVSIFVTNTDGEILYYAVPGDKFQPQKQQISAKHLRAVQKHGQSIGTGTLDGMLPSVSYYVGAECPDEQGNISAYVFISAPADEVTDLMEQVSRMFILILLMALIGTLIVSYFISARMTAPLKIMAMAAREYAAGNFDVRVPEDSHCTEIDELAVSFNNMARDLAQLDELTRGFIGNVSHEFKTPMTTIGGFVDGMLDGTIPPDQQQKYLRIISEEVRRLSRMVMRMLDAAKIQSGELILNTAPFDFTEMSSQIVLSFEQKINAKKLDVDIAFEDGLIVNGDRDHIFRAVYNLVDNAVKFIDTGGKLTLRAEAEGTFCAFSIKNTGAGISAEDIPHVFDRFYKTDRSRNLDRTGAGLGLYIVKNIINLHGGDISVRSDGGETEFSLTLPLADKKAVENFMNSSQSRQ